MSKGAARTEFQITTVPDPILREVLENLGFTYLRSVRRWVRVCGRDETEALETLLQRRGVPFDKKSADSDGRLVRFPKLSDELVLPDGGDPTRCAVCGRYVPKAFLYIECDDADNHDYPGAAKFHVCPICVEEKIAPHERLYVRVSD